MDSNESKVTDDNKAAPISDNRNEEALREENHKKIENDNETNENNSVYFNHVCLRDEVRKDRMDKDHVSNIT